MLPLYTRISCQKFLCSGGLGDTWSIGSEKSKLHKFISKNPNVSHFFSHPSSDADFFADGTFSLICLCCWLFCWRHIFSHPSSAADFFADSTFSLTRPLLLTFFADGSVLLICPCYSRFFTNLSVLLTFFTNPLQALSVYALCSQYRVSKSFYLLETQNKYLFYVLSPHLVIWSFGINTRK